MANYQLLVVFGCIFTTFAAQPSLPTFLKICHKSDRNLKRCLMESVEGLRPLLAVGIPEFGIPSCEPLIIDEVVINQGHGPVSVRSTYKDIEVFGASKFTIENIKVDLEKDRVKIKIFMEDLKINTNYTMSGKILMMPIVGSGQSFGNYSNVDATINLNAKKFKLINETYYDVQDIAIDFHIGKVKLKFDNLFNGNQELGDAMNLFLNDNWTTVSQEIKPILEDKLAEIFKRFANKIFHKYPIRMLFPE